MENKELTQMLGLALKETETRKAESVRKAPAHQNKIEQSHLPGSVTFHYRNHPNMMRMGRRFL
jgi:3-mercaptopyruvate sulfurtransferase SseA